MKTIGRVVGLLALVCAASVAAGELKIGDMATVNKDGAEIKQGRTLLATLAKGQRVKVYYVFKEGGYVRIRFTMEGKLCWGDIALKDLDAPTGVEEKTTASKNPFTADDQVVVIAKEAKLKAGDDVVGTIPEGTLLKVQKVKDDWVAVTADIKGKPTSGWVHRRDLDYPSLKEKEKDKPPPKKDEPKDK